MSNCFSGDIQFMEGRKEALKQLDKDVQELNKANWAAGPPLIIKIVSWALLMLAAAVALLYRK